jgi:hypothetical protein
LEEEHDILKDRIERLEGMLGITGDEDQDEDQGGGSTTPSGERGAGDAIGSETPSLEEGSKHSSDFTYNTSEDAEYQQGTSTIAGSSSNTGSSSSRLPIRASTSCAARPRTQTTTMTTAASSTSASGSGNRDSSEVSMDETMLNTPRPTRKRRSPGAYEE